MDTLQNTPRARRGCFMEKWGLSSGLDVFLAFFAGRLDGGQ